MIHPPTAQIRRVVRAALEEDLALGDPTTAALFAEAVQARGIVIARHDMVLAGIAVAREVVKEVDSKIKIVRALRDGTKVPAETAVLTMEGDARALLMAERVLLNFLQHLSGIATLTARFCDAVRGYRVTILDTRKTTPGLRALEKWAVRLGGGRNHRHSLGDGILIKDNHLAVLQAQHRGAAEACRLARERGPQGLKIEVEAQSLIDVREALKGDADVILLDNMTPALIRQAIALIKDQALVEISGGITLKNVHEMAASGADFISIGALTHSAPAADLSMDIMPHPERDRRRPKATR